MKPTPHGLTAVSLEGATAADRRGRMHGVPPALRAPHALRPPLPTTDNDGPST